MDLLTLAELMTLVRMCADVLGTVDKLNTVIEVHLARRLQSLRPALPSPLAIHAPGPSATT